MLISRNLPAARGRKENVIVYSSGFAEIATRFSTALSRHYDVHLFVRENNFKIEVEDVGLFLPSSLKVTKLRRPSYLHVLPRILLSLFMRRPAYVFVEETTERRLPTYVWLFGKFSQVWLRVHDPEAHSGNDRAIADGASKRTAWIRENVDVALLHGGYCTGVFSRHYRTKVHTTTHGVVLDPGDESVARPKSNRFLMFGRMEAYKGLDTLLSALKLLLARGIAPEVILAGRGDELDRLATEFVALPNVQVLNEFIPTRRLVELIQGCDAVLLPYLDATQSGVVAAAFANGRPVVASRVGGIPDVVSHGESGLLVSPGNADELARAMETLMANGELWERLENGARHAAKVNLCWDNIVEDIVSVLHKSRSPKSD